MGDERQGARDLRGAAWLTPAQSSPPDLGTTTRHAQVPTECALCGAADFSSVIEVMVGCVPLLHWVSPPHGWYLLREARPERGAPLLQGRCPVCMDRLVKP